MKIGLIGTGLMGLPMAQRLLAAEVSLMVYNRTAAKLEPLRSTQAEIATTVLDVLQQCQASILMLSNAQAIQQTVLSEANRLALVGHTLVQMGTISPSESRYIRDQVVAAGGNYVEAPVLGSIPQVLDGTLLVMVGSTLPLFEQLLPLLLHFGSEPMHVGPVGTAAALKLALNQLIAALTTGFALSLGFAQQHGVEADKFMQVLRQSALYAPTFDKKLNRMLVANYGNPNFPIKHLLKDTNLFLTEARASGQQVASLEGIRRILEMAQVSGWAEDDYSVLFAAVNPSQILAEPD